MKSSMWLIASSLIFVLIVFCSDTEAQLRNIRVCLPGNSPEFTYLFIARDRGYFAQEKMNVEVITARGQLCVTALMAEQINFTTNPNAFDLMVTGKLKGKVLLTPFKGLPHRLIVVPGVKNFGDLKGKMIAISAFGGLTDKLSRQILAQHGLEAMKDVFLMQLGTTDVRWIALKANKVQGSLLVGQYAMAALDEGFRELEYESPPQLSGPLVTKEETVARERPMVRSFVRAAIKGHIFFGQKPQETIAVMQKALRIEDRVMAGNLHKDEMRRYTPWGRADDEYLKRATDSVREDRGIKGEVDIKNVFDLSMAKEIEEELTREKWKP
jgi:NitT/TauT family transport system substrate-binding protein